MKLLNKLLNFINKADNKKDLPDGFVYVNPQSDILAVARQGTIGFRFSPTSGVWQKVIFCEKLGWVLFSDWHIAIYKPDNHMT